MRIQLTSAFVLIAFLQISIANTYAQKISLHAKNMSLEMVFAEISKQSDYDFFYSSNSIQKAKPIDIHFNNAELKEVLDYCFKNQPLIYSIKNKAVIVKDKKPPIIHHNERMQLVVSGLVTDEWDEPIAGASVKVKSSSTGTVTNTDGQFTITVPSEDDILVFSFIGFISQEQPVVNGQKVQIKLVEEISALSDVVVVGYTSKQLSNLSSSVSVVSEEELKTITSNDVTKLLQGKAPGVVVSNSSGDPTASASVVIRGSGSITASPSPLYVVDGIIGGTANPSDIETVTILKDAAATGLYGSRASNGVIIITTKTGSPGKTVIKLNSTVGFSEATTGNFRLMNSQQLYDYQKSFYPAEQFASQRPASLLSNNTNWQELAFRTGIAQNHTLSASGGSDKTQFYVAGNYFDEDGTLNLNGIKQYNIRTNLSHRINDKVKLGIKIDAGYRKTEQEASGGYGSLYGAYTNMPWDPAYNEDGSITTGNEEGWVGREHDNFLYGQQYNFDHARQSNLTGDLNLEYNIVPHLTFSTFNRGSLINFKRELYYDVRTRPGVGLGLLYNNISYNSRLITSNRLIYENNFGKHNLNIIAVGEAEKNYSDLNNLYGSGIPAGLHVMDAAALIQKPSANPGAISENVFSKGLMQVDYNFDNRYFAVASFINESSSRFGADNRSANFYTVASSWILSNEQFMQNQNIFDFLKIRGSYGITGNANIQDYQSLGLYSYSYQYSGNNAAVPFQLENSNLTWEKAKTFNIGLDMNLFKRVTLNLDWYDKTTDALLLNVQQPYTSGYSSVMQNVGSIKNRGLEVNINTKNVDESDFKWETGFNIAFNKNRVLTLYDGKDLSSGSQRISVGRDLYSWYMRKWIGVDPDNGDPLWEIITEDDNGNPTASTTNDFNLATMQFVGTASPDFTGGINNTLNYKSLSLGVFFNFVSGNLIYNSQRSAFDNDGASTEYNSMILMSGWNRWEKPGDIATHPKPVVGGNKNAQQGSSRYMEDGSYIRLQNITLGYELPDKLLTKVKVDRIRLYISGDNLWTSTRFSGMDPEVPLSPGGGSIGVSNIKYPISKKILFGINVGF